MIDLDDLLEKLFFAATMHKSVTLTYAEAGYLHELLDDQMDDVDLDELFETGEVM